MAGIRNTLLLLLSKALASELKRFTQTLRMGQYKGQTGVPKETQNITWLLIFRHEQVHWVLPKQRLNIGDLNINVAECAPQISITGYCSFKYYQNESVDSFTAMTADYVGTPHMAKTNSGKTRLLFPHTHTYTHCPIHPGNKALTPSLFLPPVSAN